MIPEEKIKELKSAMKGMTSEKEFLDIMDRGLVHLIILVGLE